MNNPSQICSMLAVLAATAVTLHAAEYTWDKGAATLDWNDPVNWSSDTKPGTADTAKFTSTGIAANDVVALGANQVVNILTHNAGNNFTIGEGSYSLTLLSGKIQGGYTGSARITSINAPIILGATGDFVGYGTDGNQTVFLQPISDGGNGYGVNLSTAGNDAFGMQGANTYGGDTTVRGRTLTLSGSAGSLLQSHLVLRPTTLTANRVGIWLTNSSDANANRLNDAYDILMENGGRFVVGISGHGTTAVQEQAGLLDLRDGILNLQANYAGADVELRFSGITRGEGAGMIVDYRGTGLSAGVNTKLTIAGAANNAAGIWQPWAMAGGDLEYDPKHVSVDASGTLLRFNSYAVLPDSGGDANTLYMASSASQTLTGPVEAYALLMRRTDNDAAVLDLGAYDLRLAGGSVGLTTHNNRTIQSSGGGRLVFGTKDVVIFGSSDSTSRTLAITAPIASDVAGPHNIVVPLVRNASLVLSGEDQIGTYAKLSADMQLKTLELGGPSDRAITNGMHGSFHLKKSGAGTLRLAGVDRRGDGSTTTVTDGRLIVGNASALVWRSYTDGSIVVTNAALEVASGIVWNGRFTIQANATLTGDGKFNTVKRIFATARVAPGKTVGKLTTNALIFDAGSHIDWELGDGVATAGTDYDLLRVEGALTLPTGVVTLNIGDAGTRTTPLRNQSFTVAEWTGTDPASAPTWSIVNQAPETVDASGAQLSIDLANNKIVLTGLKDVTPPATVIVVR